MPEQVLLIQALELSAATAVAVLLLCTWPWRSPGAVRVQLGWVLGSGLAFFLGSVLLGMHPRWPPQEDQERFLELLLPAVVAVECLAAFSRAPRWLAWTLRAVVAAGAALVLLDHTTYLDDLAGPGTREWSPAQAWAVQGGLGLALLAEWALLERLARRAPGPWLPLALAVACGGAAAAIMLSGYLTGGRIGLVLATALASAALAALVLPPLRQSAGAVGVGVVGLFGLVAIGLFFGKLTPAHAAVLFFAPLLGWLPEVAYLRKLRPAARHALRVGLVVIPLYVVLTQARETFIADSSAPSSPGEPTLQDYMDFRPE
jgi:hypothetical protein